MSCDCWEAYNALHKVSVCLQKEEDKKRLQGPGLLLLDRLVGAIRDADYYVASGSKDLQLVSGSQAEQANVVARVLLCTRPARAEIQEKSYP